MNHKIKTATCSCLSDGANSSPRCSFAERNREQISTQEADQPVCSYLFLYSRHPEGLSPRCPYQIAHNFVAEISAPLSDAHATAHAYVAEMPIFRLPTFWCPCHRAHLLAGMTSCSPRYSISIARRTLELRRRRVPAASGSP